MKQYNRQQSMDNKQKTVDDRRAKIEPPPPSMLPLVMLTDLSPTKRTVHTSMAVSPCTTVTFPEDRPSSILETWRYFRGHTTF
jgi:hypothetical protein